MSCCGISHGKIILVNWLLCYRFLGILGTSFFGKKWKYHKKAAPKATVNFGAS